MAGMSASFDPRDWLTTAQVAKLFDVSHTRVRQWRVAGLLPGTKTALGWLYHTDAVQAWQQRRARVFARLAKLRAAPRSIDD